MKLVRVFPAAVRPLDNNWILHTVFYVKSNALIVAVLLLCDAAFAQGFVNFDFELSTIISSSPSGYGFNWGYANVTGWTASDYGSSLNYSGGMSVLYNNQGLDSPTVSLVDSSYWSPALHKNYSILLFGGSNMSGYTTGASISQTGQIPIGVESITFWESSWNHQQDLQASFNGQLLYFIAISNTPNYTIYGADISAFAGQTGVLQFTAEQTYAGVIDRILFSSNPVPEPGTCVLMAVGLALLLSRRVS